MYHQFWEMTFQCLLASPKPCQLVRRAIWYHLKWHQRVLHAQCLLWKLFPILTSWRLGALWCLQHRPWALSHDGAHCNTRRQYAPTQIAIAKRRQICSGTVRSSHHSKNEGLMILLDGIFPEHRNKLSSNNSLLHFWNGYWYLMFLFHFRSKWRRQLRGNSK